jgi:hypothetical protein
MKKFLASLLAVIMIMAKVNSQDVDIVILNLNFPVAQGATGIVNISVCTNGGTAGVGTPLNRLRPRLVLPNSLTGLTAVVTTLPSGWSVFQNTGDTVIFNNTTDAMLPFQCRTFEVQYTGVNVGGPALVTGTMLFNGAPTDFDIPGNNQGTTSIQVTGCISVPTNDCDGDGVINSQETIDGTNPLDGCSYNPASVTVARSGAWNALDCDGDGVTNGTEITNSTNPLNGCSYNPASVTLTRSAAWNALDCDSDGVLNGSDNCPLVAGTVANNGCPATFVTNAPNPNNNITTTPNTPVTGNPTLNPTGGVQPYAYTGVNVSNNPTTTTNKGGNFTVNPTTGAFNYTPPTGFVGKDTFYIRVCDANTPASCATQMQVVTVANPFVTNAPNPNNNIVTNPNTPVTGNPTLNPSGGIPPYSYSGVNSTGNPSTSSNKGGTFSVNPTTGQFNYTPPTGYIGNDTFYIRVCDANTPASCATQMQVVTVGSTFVTNAPNPNSNINTPVNTPVTGNPTLNPSGGLMPYTYSGVNVNNNPTTSSNKGGTFSVNPTTGQFSYTPPTGYIGQDTFYVRVCDASTPANCATQMQIVNVNAPSVLSVNPAPAYVNTNANTPVSNNAPSTMNPQGGTQPYTYSVANAAGNPSTTSARSGSVTVDPTTGRYTYTPATNFSGADTFYIRVCDASTPVNCGQQMFIVNVAAVPCVSLGFSVANATSNCDSTRTFTATGSNPGATIAWNFGDGSTAVGTTTTHKFNTLGTFIVKQVITNASGCKDSTTQSVTISACSTPGSFWFNPFPAYIYTDSARAVSNNAGSTLAPSGGTMPYTYSAANAGGNATTTSSQGGNVTVNPTTGVYTYTPATGFKGNDTFYIRVCDASTPQNCGQQMFVVTVGNSSVTTGGGGGIESKTLGNIISQRLYGKAITSQEQEATLSTTAFTKNTGVIVNGPADLKLSDLVPATVAGTDKALISTPADLVNFTNAVEVLSVDYTRSNTIKAVAFSTQTVGEVYNHTKPICDRLKGATLLEVKTINISGYNVMAYKVQQCSGEVEYAINLHAGVKAGRSSISVQSNWFTDSYVQDEKMFNFQLWAVSYDMASNMAKDIITKLQQTGTVQAVTSTDLPRVYVTKGKRVNSKVSLEVINNTTATTAVVELREKATETSVEVTRQVPVTLRANGQSTLEVDVKDSYEATISLLVQGNKADMLYLNDGTWALDYNRANTSIQEFVVSNDVAQLNNTSTGDYNLLRNVSFKATSKDYVTAYKTIGTKCQSLTISDYNSLKFKANAVGAGSVKVTLISSDITNWSEQYTATVTLDGDKEYGIGLSDFVSSKYTQTVKSRNIIGVSFAFNNSRGTVTTMTGSLSKARFTKEVIAASSAAQMVKIYPNPVQTNMFTTSFTSEVEQSVVIRVVEVGTGKVIKTQFVLAKKGVNQVQVQLDKATNNGNYTVEVQADEAKYQTQKLMIIRK